MQETSIRTRDSLKIRQTELSEEFQKLALKNSEIEYKVAQALKQVEIHNVMIQQQTAQGGQAGPDSQALVPINGGGAVGHGGIEQATQVAFLRDQLMQEA